MEGLKAGWNANRDMGGCVGNRKGKETIRDIPITMEVQYVQKQGRDGDWRCEHHNQTTILSPQGVVSLQ